MISTGCGDTVEDDEAPPAPLNDFSERVFKPGERLPVPKPTYAAATGTVAEAWAERDRIIRYIEVSRFGRWGGILAGDTPVFGINGPSGIGKTDRMLKCAAGLALAGEHVVVAVPRHKLGDQIVRDLADLGVTAHCYRGREADDPVNSKLKMCRRPIAVNAITFSIHEPEGFACKNKAGDKCEYYDGCPYQKQKQQTPMVWVIPHQLLFEERPSFIPKPDFLIIDESFFEASFPKNDIILPLDLFLEYREVPLRKKPQKPRKFVTDEQRRENAIAGTADLLEYSRRVYDAIIHEPAGRLKRAQLLAAGLGDQFYDKQRKRNISICNRLWDLELQGKLAIEVNPSMSEKKIEELCEPVSNHNQDINKRKRFYELAKETLENGAERSIWLDYNPNMQLPDDKIGPGICMSYRKDIHETWHAKTTVLLDGTMNERINSMFFPAPNPPFRNYNIKLIADGVCGSPIVYRIDAAMPHVHVRQIIDRSFAKNMVIPYKHAKNEKTNKTRLNNINRIRLVIEVEADKFRFIGNGKVLVICPKDLEKQLRDARSLGANVDFTHFNATSGLNSWEDVTLLIIVGRPEASPRTVEDQARQLFRREVAEIEAGKWYPQVQRVIRVRDGNHVAVMGPQHPDPFVETVRRTICEAEVMQDIGRGRGVNRTEANPLHVLLLTDVVLPIEVDKVMTWKDAQPTPQEVMEARGVYRLSGHVEQAMMFPDLFSSAKAAEHALSRKNPPETPNYGNGLDGSIKTPPKRLIGKDLPIRSLGGVFFRRQGSRGPAGFLEFDPAKIPNPQAWLSDDRSPVTILKTEDDQ